MYTRHPAFCRRSFIPLRIYALGYAGFIVSETVNMLGGKLPFILAIFVIVFGHILNIMTIAILAWYRMACV